MQRRLRITLAVTAAVGALALGAGTAFADDSSEMEGNTTPEVSSTGVNGLSGTEQLGTAEPVDASRADLRGGVALHLAGVVGEGSAGAERKRSDGGRHGQGDAQTSLHAVSSSGFRHTG